MAKKLILNIGRRKLIMRDLEHSINEDFISLFRYFLGISILNVDKFKKNSFDFFDSIKYDSEKYGYYFDNFKIIWRILKDQLRLNEAEDLWKFVLEISTEWEKRNNISDGVPKGTLYYFWATTCILKDDIEKAFSLMNEAYLEDVKAYQNKETKRKPEDAPAGLFLHFEPDRDQYLKPELDKIKNFLDKFIEEYSNFRNRQLSYGDFEQKFLQPNIRREIRFQFNLNIFRLEKLLNRYPSVRDENTVSCLIYLETIFGFCRVLDLIITKKKFRDAIIDLAKKYKKGNTIQNNAFDKLNSEDFNTNNFFKTLESISKSKYKINTYTPDQMEKDILISYGFRNFGAHEIKEYPLIVGKFPEICQRVINSIFLATELYL